MIDFKKIAYVSRHRKQVRVLYKSLVGRVPIRAYLHDLDKLILLLIGVDSVRVSKLHRNIAKHHNPKETSYPVLLEMVIDWESARFTKLDKPLNARDTLYKYYPEMEDKILPILNKLKI